MGSPKKLTATVANIEEHTPTLFTLSLRPDEPKPPFEAGQFLHLALDIYDPSGPWPESRVFSIASSPTQELLRVTYVVKGEFTQRMARDLRVGSTVQLKMAYGSFRVQPEKGLDTVLISGGTGIAPFISFLEQARDEGSKGRFTLFYGVQSPEVLLFREFIERLKESLRNFSAWIFLEEGHEAIKGSLRGRLRVEEILAHVDDVAKCVFFLSGPPAMVEKLRSDLCRAGISQEAIRTDDWG